MNEIRPSIEPGFREFLRKTFPELEDANIVYSRLCMYCDSFDGDFFIDNHPNIRNLTIASGDSGHGFKFFPVIGEIIVDVF